MFQGSSEISMDPKGRIAIPTKVRELLATVCDGKIVITASLDSRCLSIYPALGHQGTRRALPAAP